MKKTKFQIEYRTLELRIKENTGINRARIYIIVGLIIAIIKLGRVNLKKLAPLINPKRSALRFYKRRWEIETLFSAFKTRGFNLEETHMSNPKKLDTLFTLLSLAFVWSHTITALTKYLNF